MARCCPTRMRVMGIERSKKLPTSGWGIEASSPPEIPCMAVALTAASIIRNMQLSQFQGT